VSFPGANMEIKIVLPISLKDCPRRVRIRLWRRLSGLQGESQAAQQKAGS